MNKYVDNELATIITVACNREGITSAGSERIVKAVESYLSTVDYIKPPCKVGDTVYVIREFLDKETRQFYASLDKGVVKHIYLNSKNRLYAQVICDGLADGFMVNGKRSKNFAAENVFTDETVAKERLLKYTIVKKGKRNED